MPSQARQLDDRPRQGAETLPVPVLPALAGLAVLVLAFVTFLPALSAGFINLDDDIYVSANEHIQQGLTAPAIGWAWTSNYLGYEIPFTWMSYMLDTDLFGKGPWGYHFTNVILHAANAVLLMAVLRRATGSTWRSALAAALWAVHPLRVESVAWVTERKDVLAGSFALIALYAYVRYAQAPARWRFVAVAVAYSVSLLSKPPLAAALPVSVWLLDYWPLGRMAGGPGPAMPGDVLSASRAESRRKARKPAGSLARQPRSAWRLAIEKWPLLAVAALAGLVLAAGMKREIHFEGDVNVSWGGKLANAVVAPVRSLEREVWFKHLAVVYPMPLGWPPARVLIAGAALLTVTGIVLWQRKRFPWLTVGWFWFAVNFAPSVGLVQGGLKVAMGDRYTYFPAIGLVVMLVWSIPESWAQTASRRAALGAAAVACLGALIVSTRVQLSYWQDSVSIMRHAVAVTNGNWMAHLDLGTALYEQRDNDQALEHFNKSIQINPNYPFAWEDAARLLNEMGRYAEAAPYADRAVAIEPASPRAHQVREVSLMKRGRFEEAILECKAILKLDPRSADAENDIAFALAKLGRRGEAISHLQKALELDPNNPAARENIARAMYQVQHPPPATRP